ncbi:MAG: M23 family metallopeptidase, partial [Endomicrobiia bacterium]|nr:M23 family metallopeptidase [Endomicrobiia bacterium]
EVVTSTDGSLISFSYYPYRGIQYFEINRRGGEGGFVATAINLPVEIAAITAQGQVKSSLWEAMSAKGLDGELIIRFAELFSSQVDFLTDTREGDEFKIIWEEKVVGRDDRKRRIIEKIVAAEYTNRGERFVAVGFGGAALDYDYYSPDGKSLRLAFSRAPLSYRRISSYFSRKRFHPVLRIYRPHHGVDYVAPSGTPVSAIGDGTIVFKGWSGGYGNLARVRHPNGYESYYGHLSRFAKISRGARVRQGQVVGYVGATGVATGPHLHFEMRSGRAPMNFLALRLPSKKKIPDEHKAEFVKVAQDARARLDDINKR